MLVLVVSVLLSVLVSVPFYNPMPIGKEKIFELARGFRGRAKNCIKIARNRVEKALQHSFRGNRYLDSCYSYLIDCLMRDIPFSCIITYPCILNVGPTFNRKKGEEGDF